MPTNSRTVASQRFVSFSRLTGLVLAGLFASGAASCGSASGTGDPNPPGDMSTASQPTLFGLSPDVGPLAGGTTITITGTEFREGAQVKFGGIAASNVVVKSSVEIRVTLPAWQGAIGPVEVSVDNPDGGRVASSSLFSYVRSVLQFAPTVTRSVGRSPIALAAEDVNGDGGKELLVANNIDGSLSVLLNNLDFNPSGGPYATPALPNAIAIADINGDGRRDVVLGCGNASSQEVSVLRGMGNGAFMTGDNFSVGGTVSSVAVKDFDGDGKPDVAATVRPANKLVVLSNTSANPAVSFAPTQTSYTVSGEPAALLLSDLNSDGRDDVVLSQYGMQQVGVLLASSAGGSLVTPIKTASVGLRPIALTAAELTGDGRVDVVSANFDGNSLSLLTGQNDGTFGSVSTISVGEKPTAVATGDINQDGKLDLIVANSGRNQIWVLLGRGDGNFDPPQKIITGTQPWALVVTNLDGDAKPDIAVTNLADNSVSIFLNRTQ